MKKITKYIVAIVICFIWLLIFTAMGGVKNFGYIGSVFLLVIPIFSLWSWITKSKKNKNNQSKNNKNNEITASNLKTKTIKIPLNKKVIFLYLLMSIIFSLLTTWLLIVKYNEFNRYHHLMSTEHNVLASVGMIILGLGIPALLLACFIFGKKLVDTQAGLIINETEIINNTGYSLMKINYKDIQEIKIKEVKNHKSFEIIVTNRDYYLEKLSTIEKLMMRMNRGKIVSSINPKVLETDFETLHKILSE